MENNAFFFKFWTFGKFFVCFEMWWPSPFFYYHQLKKQFCIVKISFKCISLSLWIIYIILTQDFYTHLDTSTFVMNQLLYYKQIKEQQIQTITKGHILLRECKITRQCFIESFWVYKWGRGQNNTPHITYYH